ncbi:MAG: hypothetical protein NTW87_24375 [Planctomycetota bacterium]|nr:hypothetical protein [Planctomycetota bacterium]
MTDTTTRGNRQVYTGELVPTERRRLFGADEPPNAIVFQQDYSQIEVVLLKDYGKVQPLQLRKLMESPLERRARAPLGLPDPRPIDVATQAATAEFPVTAQGILRELLADVADVDRRPDLVIMAEAVEFTPDEQECLAPALFQFIEEKRDSNDPSELTAVAAAIRKYVGIIQASEIGSLAVLLDPGRPLPLDNQVEVAKMIARKFAAVPPSRPNPEPMLASRLAELALAHLNPHVLSEGKNAAVAMNALMGLASMLSPEFGNAMARLRKPWCEWFRAQFCRRLQRVLTAWENDPSVGQRTDIIEGLRKLLDLARGR